MTAAITTPAIGARDQARLPSLDLWLALLAGDRVWIEEDDRADSRARIAAGLELLGLLGAVSRLWLVLPDRLDLVENGTVVWVAAVAGTLAALAVAVRPAGMVAGRTAGPANLAWRALWRGVAFLVLVVSLATVLPGLRSLGAWPLGVVAGADITLSVRSLGIEPQPWRWWRRFLVSPIHLGAVGAVSATLVVRGLGESTLEVLALYVTMQLGVATACFVIWALARLDGDLRDEVGRELDEVVERERRHRAHWLHDDVLSEIRLTSLRVQSAAPGSVDVAQELGDLDHRLRLRQVDELFAGGSARLADILQPHVRRAQALGVEVTEVPSYDDAGRVVDVATGRLFARAVSVLTSNAINAGTSTLAIKVRVKGPIIELHVTDDAGGFGIENIPAGRGLDQLAQDIGRANLWITPVSGGSTVSVRLEDRS